MRTKVLLVAAAILAAGLATSLAQTNVYSQNVVGYVNISLPDVATAGGYQIVGNPLNNSNNTLAVLIPNPVVGTKVFYYSGGSPVVCTFAYDDDDNLNWGTHANDVLAPGMGFWMKNPASTNQPITFVGEVAQGNRTNAIPSGFSLKASIVPQSGALDSLLGYVPTVESTKVYQYASGSFVAHLYKYDDDDNPYWQGGAPTPGVAEGFWIRENSATEWIRNFTVQ